MGAFGTRVSHNRVFGNRPSGNSSVSGGIAVTKIPGGTDPQNDVVRHNKAFDNEPDLFWDGTGSVLFKRNKCGTSVPDGLCTSGSGKAHQKQRGEAPLAPP